ncbi:MAG TPA: Crp/Fnr family transcriptional regulator [Vicinamibacterales bacterium]|nr:Crp/Fnr family transcriptional regulator [Vicinamibacterales bacterium]
MPSLRAMSVASTGVPAPAQLLTNRQRQQLATIATRLRLRPRMTIYEAGSPARWVFVNDSGVVKTFRDLPSGKRRVTAFLFARDIFGLAENGRYVNSAQPVTEVTLYRFPIESLEQTLRADGNLQFLFLLKITHELRQAQQLSVALTRRDAAGKVAMFLSMLERQNPGANPAAAIPVPMSRSDVANYVGLSLEAVSRATSDLVRRRIISTPDRHSVRIVDRARFDRLVQAV